MRKKQGFIHGKINPTHPIQGLFWWKKEIEKMKKKKGTEICNVIGQ